MMLAAFYKDFVVQLKKIYEDREANNIADLVFESEGVKKLDRITDKQKQLNILIVEKLKNKLRELLQHKPVQYVLGEAWFYKMKLKVNEHVLIPRPETEELVEWVVQELKMKNEKLKILDIGTGSGCISIALKKELPNTDITSIDVSEKALELAMENADDQKIKMDFIKLDFINETEWQQLPSFDIIISNPPYIPQKEKIKLNKNVTQFEPHIALFVDDNDPFIFYKKIAKFSRSHLNDKGKIFLEGHEDYAEDVVKIFSENNYQTIIKKDIYGKQRMIKAFK